MVHLASDFGGLPTEHRGSRLLPGGLAPSLCQSQTLR